MSLSAFTAAVDDHLDDLDDVVTLALDGQTKREIALLAAAFEPASVDELVRQAIHLYAQDAVDRGAIDLQLRSGYGITYDEFLAGMTYEEMGGSPPPTEDDERRYRF